MYKLTVVAGPNRGTSYPINSGETSIGRQTGNVIVLSSSKVSKRHCTIEVQNEDLVVKDQGSSNGTFVNGVLTKLRKVKAGDRISVGEFVLEVVKPQARAPRAAPAVAGMGAKVVQFPGARGPGGMGLPAVPSQPMDSSGASSMVPQGPPKDIKGRLIWMFEHKLMPVFYGMLLKNEWRMIGIGLFSAFMVGNLLVSVYPIMEQGRQQTVKEAQRRARFMARQIVDRNSAALAARAETKTDIGNMEKEPGVRAALLMDLENRIIAPGNKLNTYFTAGSEAQFAVRMRGLFQNGREEGIATELDAETVVAVEPVKVLHPQMGKNVVIGMALISLDTAISTPDIGEIGVMYSETLVLTGLLGGIIFLIFYRLTLKPLEILNDDIDRVLKGDMNQVTREFKFGELDSLMDVINSALQRVPRGGAPGSGAAGGGFGGGGASMSEEFAGPMKMIAGFAKFGMVILDAERKIVNLNAMFEEISGIRGDGAVGQDIPSVARDQAFGAFANDLFDRAPVGGEGVTEDFEFSGIVYKMHVAALGTNGTARGYVICAVRQEG